MALGKRMQVPEMARQEQESSSCRASNERIVSLGCQEDGGARSYLSDRQEESESRTERKAGERRGRERRREGGGTFARREAKREGEAVSNRISG